MWVKINKSYAGPLGMFVIGERRDIDEKILKQLPGDCFEISIAPWEEHVDHKAVAAAELKQKALAAIAGVESMQAEMVGLRKVAGRINVLKKEIDDAVAKAKALAQKAGIAWPANTGTKAAGQHGG